MLDGELPVNHAILGNLQDVFNLLPNLATPKPTSSPAQSGADSSPTDNSELARAMSIKTNDQLMAIYLSSLIRAITAFHDLIDNKIQNRKQQEEKDAKKEESKDSSKKVNGVVNGESKDGGDVEKEKDREKTTTKGKDKEKDKDSKKG